MGKFFSIMQSGICWVSKHLTVLSKSMGIVTNIESLRVSCFQVIWLVNKKQKGALIGSWAKVSPEHVTVELKVWGFHFFDNLSGWHTKESPYWLWVRLCHAQQSGIHQGGFMHFWEGHEVWNQRVTFKDSKTEHKRKVFLWQKGACAPSPLLNPPLCSHWKQELIFLQTCMSDTP